MTLTQDSEWHKWQADLEELKFEKEESDEVDHADFLRKQAMCTTMEAIQSL